MHSTLDVRVMRTGRFCPERLLQKSVIVEKWCSMERYECPNFKVLLSRGECKGGLNASLSMEIYKSFIALNKKHGKYDNSLMCSITITLR